VRLRHWHCGKLKSHDFSDARLGVAEVAKAKLEELLD
jgi:hypothetical protein